MEACINVKERAPLTPVLRRSFKEVDFTELNSRVSSIAILEPVASVEDLVNSWYKDFLLLLDEVAPIKQFPRFKSPQRWICQDTKKLVRHRESMSKKLKKDPNNAEIHEC